MMCLTCIGAFVVTMYQPQRDERDVLTLALAPINAVFFGTLAMYAHQRLRAKTQA